MRTVIDINRSIWANVRHFATTEQITLNIAVERLLERALTQLRNEVNQEGE